MSISVKNFTFDNSFYFKIPAGYKNMNLGRQRQKKLGWYVASISVKNFNFDKKFCFVLNFQQDTKS